MTERLYRVGPYLGDALTERAHCGLRSAGAATGFSPHQSAAQTASPQGEANGGLRAGPSEYNLSVGLTPASSLGRGAFGKEVSLQRKGELAGLSATPEPPLLGEVALRSNDGEVVQSRTLSGICVASPFGRGGNAPALTERASLAAAETERAHPLKYAQKPARTFPNKTE